MLYVDRSSVPVPEGLTRDNSVKANLREIGAFMALESQERAQKRPPQTINSHQVTDLKESLYTLFNGRCAFCERETHTPNIHRFRPARNAHQKDKKADGRLYYLWFAWVWQNFYLACAECNMLMKNRSPVSGKQMPIPSVDEYEYYLILNRGVWPQWPPKETTLLLDPCQTKNMATYFNVRPDGDLIPLNRRADSTITFLDLNRRELRENREDRFFEYFNNLIKAIEYKNDLAISEALFFKKMEFGGCWYLLFRRMLSTCTGLRGKRLSITRIHKTFVELLRTSQVDVNKINETFQLLKMNGEEMILSERTNSTLNYRLRSARFQNFKLLENVQVIIPDSPELCEGQKPEAQALLILGENAAGKSTLLEGVALALVSYEGRAKLKLDFKEYIFSPQLLAGDANSRPARARVDLIQDNGESLTLMLYDAGAEVTKSGLFNVGPVFAYGAFRQYRKVEKEQYRPDKSVRNLFDGSLLGNPQTWLLSLDDGTFDSVVSALREVLSIEGEFKVIQRSYERGECYIVTEIGNIQTRTPLNVASSGFRTVLAMVCDILQGLMDKRLATEFNGFEQATGIVLIDEVETHLHPRWKMQIMGGLRRALPGMTFIVTTHDPLCLRGMNNGEVIVMQRVAQKEINTNEKGTHKIEVRSDLPDITKMRVDQLLTSDFFQLSSTDEPEMEQQLAHIADLLAKRERAEELTEFESAAIETFERDIASALPVGTSEAHRVVQEAVASYLNERRQATIENMQTLRESTRNRILDILRRSSQ